ncbi:LysR family transcriptional regulator [Streptomyces caatingaensis]|uniref:LysR family transcriptional regulator n=1 Tax=Streptomyces caatingaensis TaxID=1678637 RepID=A0A0K9XIK5_9ACTN|nr:LysR substrate-binding domain-containing protein [Streptomyces caatingaensis]KNB53143.1 LysR family transcriptional regulator [Streptomyces caatingaensis]
MDFRQLEYFLAIVDEGGFHRAAAALYVSQPALSQAVRSLERDLGGALFHRVGRRAVLTEAGRALIEPARAAVRSLRTARAGVAAVHELRAGRLDVAAMPSQAVEPLTTMIRAFGGRWPGVTVAVRAALTAREVVTMVRTGAAELGLLAVHGPLPGRDVTAHPLGEQRFVLLAPHDGPFAGRRSVHREELAGHRLVVGQRGTGMRAYVDGLRDGGISFQVAAETEHRAAVLPLVLGGVGLAVVAESWRELAERAGARVLAIEPRSALSVGLISREGPLSPAADAFLRTATAAAAP